jgi:hypothetical protein
MANFQHHGGGTMICVGKRSSLAVRFAANKVLSPSPFSYWQRGVMTSLRDTGRRRASFPLAVGVLGLICLTPATVSAQVAGATLSGTVVDASGATVHGARLDVKNVATVVVTSVATNSNGIYVAPNLLPGDYVVTATAKGFTTEVRTGITLTVGAEQRLNFTLAVGSVTETVQVSGAPPSVDSVSSAIGAVIDPTTVVELPLNGRDWVQLATLETGVHTIPTQPAATGISNRENRGIGTQLSISGTRPQQSNYRLDGVSITDYAGGGPGSVAGVAMGVDAIAEFSVLTSNSSAEYGRTSGGVVNATTRSGTNQLHGDVYWFLRDEDFDARNYFDTKIAPFHRNQFGGSLGGPIWKDKTFFFTDYEGLREDLGISNVDIVPSPDARNGIIHNADGTTCTIGIATPGCSLKNSAGTVGVDPAVKPYLNFYPLPDAGLIGVGNTGEALVSTGNMTSENFETVRIDHKISEKDSAFGSWLLDRAKSSAPDSLDTWLIGNTSSRQFASLEETHVFGASLVNSLRVGFNRVVTVASTPLQAINPITADTSLGSFPGQTAATFAVSGVTPTSGGLGALTYLAPTWNSFQGYDDAFLTRGLHSIKFGFGVEEMHFERVSITAPTGAFSFGSLTNFLTNRPNSFKGQLPGTAIPRRFRQVLFAGYIQDDWRIRPNLTLNLGLRYEATTVPTETQNHLSNLATLTSPTATVGSPFFKNPTLRNFEPRVGFSWDPFHDGKTAVRGAFGVFDVLPLLYEFSFAQGAAAPFSVVLSIGGLPAGSFPTAAANTTNISPSKLINSLVQANPPRNYLMIWNLNVQHQLTASTTVTIGYVGNHGVHMVDRADDVNTVQPTVTSAGLLWPYPSGSGTKLNPNSGAIRALFWKGGSVYDALEASVTKTMSHGFQVQGSYTWAKGIDTNSSSGFGDQFTNSISSLYTFCRRCTRGLSDFNIAQSLGVSYIWNIPSPARAGAIESKILKGWELGGILTAQSGVPFTPLIGGDPLGESSTDPYAFPNRVRSSGCGSLVNPGNPKNYVKLNCFSLPTPAPDIAARCTSFSAVPGTCENLYGNAGRNSIIGPGLLTWDTSLFKNTYIPRISKTFNFQLRAEAFNVLNRANFAAPIDNQTLFDQSGSIIAGAGSVDQTSTPARELQFAAKVIW